MLDLKKWIRLDYQATYLANKDLQVFVSIDCSNGQGSGSITIQMSRNVEQPQETFEALKISASNVGGNGPATNSVSFIASAGTFFRVEGTESTPECECRVSAMIPSKYLSESVEKKNNEALQVGRL